jgi:phosphonate transport system permease protein
MTTAVSILPSPQLALLNENYRKAVARKRLRLTFGAALFFAALVIAAIGAEVNLRTFFSYFGNFVSYFSRILTLETAPGYGPMSASGSGAGTNGSRCSARPC